MTRKEIPLSVRQRVMIEAGYRCSIPSCRNILALDLHHIIQVSEDGGNSPDNLIALCGFCHDLYHKGEISKEAIRYWKGMQIALNNAFDREVIDNLLFLHRLGNARILEFSGDGVLRFSRLISAGLASFSLTVYLDDGAVYYEMGDQGNPFSPPSTRGYRVRLTSKGQMLVDAWLKGNQTELQNALAQI